ncbi:MAG: hypothetical protein JSU63_04135 [Phycisphaerales bacterium]|nr:MAG: hypothetical protein JSU63_04135 [Phycisphaerales bacterium]
MRRHTSVTSLVSPLLFLPVVALAVIHEEVGYRIAKHVESARDANGLACSEPVSADMLDAARAEISGFGAVRSVSDTVAPNKPTPKRAAKAEGDPCGCDSECADLTYNGGCMVGQCVRYGEVEEYNLDGTCQRVSAPPGTRCEVDGDPCTVGRCDDNYYARCMDGPIDPECDNDEDCIAGYGRGSVSPCASECVGGTTNGQNCDTIDDCDRADGVNLLGCQPKPGVICTDLGGGAYDCSYDNDPVAPGVQAVGRCCGGDSLPAVFTDQAACEADNGTWVEITDPDDLMHLPVRCPAYSSGLGTGGSDDGNPVGPIVPPVRQCSRKSGRANYGEYCEVDADCAWRCVGGDDDGVVCTRDEGCADGTCEPDTCVDVTDGIGRCDGFYMIGDDYQLSHGSYIILQEIRWRGGTGLQNEVVSFDFYTHEDLDPTGPTRLFTWSVRFDKGGTVGTYWLEPNCDPNCDPEQECPGQSCECRSTSAADGGGCWQDPPLIIPPRGYMVVHAARFRTDGIPNDLTGFWIPSVAGANIGANDADVMWIDDGPIGGTVILAGVPHPGSRVLAFELIGIPVDDPVGACCDGTSCTDVLQPNCRFCAGDGPNVGEVCDRGNDNWGSMDRDCWGLDEECLTLNYLGPRTRADFLIPEASDAKVCADGPCAFGACCFADGSCDDEHDAVWCADNSGTFTGSGIDCDPNCCEQPYQGSGEELGGDCCGDVYWCTGTVAGYPVPGGTRCDPQGVDPYNCFSTCECSIDNTPCDIAGGECHNLAYPLSSSNAPCSLVTQDCIDPNETCEYVETCGNVCGRDFELCEPGVTECSNLCSEGRTECVDQSDCHFGWCTNLPIPCDDRNLMACNYHPELCEITETCDPQTCKPQVCECGTCEQVCEGPTAIQATVPPYPDCLDDDTCTNRYDFTTDSRLATDEADYCAADGDAGWYHSIHVDECARITFTYCCNSPTVDVDSPFLASRCPCSGGAEYRIFPDPGRAGFGDQCGNDHCCTDGNYSAQWTVAPGTYWLQLPAGRHCEHTDEVCSDDSDCRAAALCLDEKRVYQGHWIVEPCIPGVCCFADQCGPGMICDEGSDNFGQPCELDDDCPPNPGGVCRTFNPTTDPPELQLMTKLECEELRGDFLSRLEPDPITDCASDPCELGACCLLDGECRHDSAVDTQTLCESMPGGEFHGGVLCSHRPCKVCYWDDLDHCQTGNSCCYNADRNQGFRAADDFRAAGDTIDEICLEVGYYQPVWGPCMDDPPDEDFIIRFYEDDNGFPGAELPGSPGPWIPDKRARVEPDSYYWRYSGDIDPPVQVEAGECYWIEFSGMGDDCVVLVGDSLDGNDYHLQGSIEADGTPIGEYGQESISHRDLAFCVGSGMIPGIEPGLDGGCGDFQVACCTPGGGCHDGGTLNQCKGTICAETNNIPYPQMSCSEVEDGAGCQALVPANDLCENAMPICTDMGPDPNLGVCTYDPYLAYFGPVCELGSDECEYFYGDCEEWDHPIGGDVYRCTVTGDNIFAGTDGPDMIDTDCEYSGDYSLQADVWYEITAPCTGDMRIILCRSEWSWDAMMEVFGNHTDSPTCYENELDCNDDGCNGSRRHYPTVPALWLPYDWENEGVTAGAVYQIRIGGHSNAGDLTDAKMGTFNMEIGFTCHFPPMCGPMLPGNPVHQQRKNRYLSIDPSTCGDEELALRVELTSLLRCEGDLHRSCNTDADCPGVCDDDPDTTCLTDAQCPGGTCTASAPCGQHPSVGLVKWVQNPQREPMGCRLPGGCTDEDWFARLGDTPLFRNWANFGDADSSLLHISDCAIVPVATYELKFCYGAELYTCLEPLTIGTIKLPPPHNYGDVVGPVDPVAIEFGPPDQILSVGDVSAYLLTNQNYGLPGDPKPQAHWTWVDLEGEGAPFYRPQGILGVGDLGQILFGYSGRPYSWAGNNVDPGDCPPG